MEQHIVLVFGGRLGLISCQIKSNLLGFCIKQSLIIKWHYIELLDGIKNSFVTFQSL